ncbi:MAG: PAS domain S-box protein [Candidatus Krumholzibacteriota bacterium]|nr:PAS domain S-box protein [Candidatus Krumholzibacteriota bacterium]
MNEDSASRVAQRILARGRLADPDLHHHVAEEVQRAIEAARRPLDRELSARRDYARRLARETRLFRRAFAALDAAALLHDLSGRLLDANQEACSLIGLSRDKLRGRRLQELVPDLARDAGFAAHLADGRAYRAVHRLRAADGAIRELALRSRRLDGRDNAALTLLLERSQQDITVERIRALNRLKGELLGPAEPKQRLQRVVAGILGIFDAEFVRIWITATGECFDAARPDTEFARRRGAFRRWDYCLRKGGIGDDAEAPPAVDLKRTGCYRIGLVARGHEPKFVTNAIHDDLPMSFHSWPATLASFAGYRLLSAEGRVIGVLALFSRHPVAPDSDAVLEDLAVTTAQVIERGRSEMALARLADRPQALERVLNYSPAVALLWRPEPGWPVEYVSDSVRRFGYDAEDFHAGRLGLAAVVHAEDRADLADALAVALADPACQTLSREYRILTGDGGYRWVDDRTWIGRDERGAVTHCQGLLVDITDRRRAEAGELLVTRVSTYFANLEPDDIDAGVDWALKLLGDFLHADRCTVFWLLSEGGGEASLVTTHEWCGHGIIPQRRRQPLLPAADLPWLMEILRRFENVSVDDATALPRRANSERDWLRGREARAAAFVPLVQTRRLVGFVACEALRRGHDWNAEDLRLVRTVAGLTVSGLARKRAAQLVRESERKYRSLFDTSGDGIAFLDLTGRFELTNAALQGMLGYASEELRGRSFLDVTAAPYRDDDRLRLAAMVAGRRSEDQHEKEYLRRDGAAVPVSVRAWLVRDEAGRPQRLMALVRDISERRQAEAALRASEARHRLLFNTMVDGFALSETVSGSWLESRLLEVNPTFAALLETPVAEFAGRTLCEALPACFRQDAPTPAADDGSLRFECHWGERNRYFAVSAYRPQAGQYATVLSDITEQRRLEGQLRRAQRLEAIGTLAGGIAHDFNNILYALLGYADLVMDDLAPDSTAVRNMEQIIKAGNRASELVKQILAFSKRGEQDQQPVRLQPLVEETLGLLAGRRPAGVSLRREIDPGCGPVLAVPAQIQQVVMNLCTNALRAMAETGGTLTVGLREVHGQAARGAVREPRAARYLRLTVTDTGVGMDAAVRERIFEPYFSTRRAGEGTGLGLATVHGIVERYGGSITVASEPGAGARFDVYLPRHEEPAAG